MALTITTGTIIICPAKPRKRGGRGIVGKEALVAGRIVRIRHASGADEAVLNAMLSMHVREPNSQRPRPHEAFQLDVDAARR